MRPDCCAREVTRWSVSCRQTPATHFRCAPPGQVSVNLCIPLSSLLMTCAYVRTIERWREVFILAPTPNERAHLTTHERATNDSHGRSNASEIWDEDHCSEERSRLQGRLK